MSAENQPQPQAMEEQKEVYVGSEIPDAESAKYVIPEEVFCLKEGKKFSLSDMSDLLIVPDKNGKMTLRGKVIGKDGKPIKTSTYLALKPQYKQEKKRAPRKRKPKAPKAEPAVIAAAAELVSA